MYNFKNFMCMAGLTVTLFLISAMYNTCHAEMTGWIAFGSTQDGDWDIWAIRPDGTGLRQLSNLPGHQIAAQWSPDSTKILYSSDNAQLSVYDWVAGTNTKIYDAHDYEGHDHGSYGVY